VSPDSKRIALFFQKGSNLKEMQIHELQSGSLLSTIQMVPANESRTVSSLVLTQNTFVARSNKNEAPGESLVEAWDAASGQKLWDMPQIRLIQSGTSAMSIMALTPEGKTFLVDADTGRALGEDYSFFENRFIPSTDQCAFLGNGTAVFNAAGSVVRKIDGKNVSLAWVVPCSFASPLAIRVSASGYHFAALGRRSMLGSVLEIRSSDGFLLKSAPFQNKAGISRIARSRDCFAIATAERILVWNLRRNPPLRSIAVDNNNFTSFAPASGGSKIASATHTLQDGHQLSLWNAEPTRAKSTKSTSAAIEGLVEKRGPALLANPEGTHLLMALDDRAATARVEAGEIQTVLKGQKLPVAFPATSCAVALHPTGDRFLLGGKIFDFVTGSELVSLKRPLVVLSRVATQRYSGGWVGSDHVVQIASFHAEEEEESDEKRILVLSNALTGDIEAKVSAPTVASLAASPDGKWIAEGGTDKRLRIRDGKTLEVEHDLRAHDAPVAALAWHPTRPLLASAERGRIRIWNTQTWRILEHLDVVPEEAALDITEDGKQLILLRKTVDYYEPESFRE
jgi:hypothetical protein